MAAACGESLGIGLGYSRTSSTEAPTLTAQIPNPAIFNSPRTATASTGDLEHIESAIHLQFLWMVPISNEFQIALIFGPSFYNITQDFVGNIGITEGPPPYGTVAISSVEVLTQSERATGFTAGVDATYLFTPVFGVGGFMRFTGADADMETAGGGTVDGRAQEASSWAWEHASASRKARRLLYLQTSNTAGFRRLVIAGGAAAFLLLLLRTAWLDDDAYITFRTVDNFLNGLGLRWNVVNRVQAFTHPLWMFAVAAAAAIGGEVYFSSLALSIVVSLAAVTLAASRIASTLPMAVLVFMSLALSKAFVDYSTSGLENPLTHLLLVGFFLGLVSDLPRPRRLLVLSLATALLMVNRFDTGLLVLPALAVEIWRSGWRAAVVPVAVGMLPLAAWEVFSVVYYGFPFPNTAYSKLKTGVPAPEIHYQGFLYLLDSIANDPLTLLVIATAILGPIAFGGGLEHSDRHLRLPRVRRPRRRRLHERTLPDRAVSPVGVVAVASPDAEFRGAWAFATAAVAVVGLSAPRPTILSNGSYGSDIEPARVIAPTGITDERRYYYPQSGLLTALRGVPMPNHRWTHMGHDLTNRGETFFSTDAAGFIGYAAGPGVTFLDRYGLGDPLIARLPAEAPWRIGHFVREVPEGYAETLRTGRDHIRDSGVAVYYDKLQIITEGPLFTAERWHTILRMNLGRYERYIADYGLRRVRWEDVAAHQARSNRLEPAGERAAVAARRGGLAPAGQPRPHRAERLAERHVCRRVPEQRASRGGAPPPAADAGRQQPADAHGRAASRCGVRCHTCAALCRGRPICAGPPARGAVKRGRTTPRGRPRKRLRARYTWQRRCITEGL